MDNGVNVEALLGARELFGDNPDLGKTQWRSTTTWQRGTHSTSTIESFFTLGAEQQHRTSFTLIDGARADAADVTAMVAAHLDGRARAAS